MKKITKLFLLFISCFIYLDVVGQDPISINPDNSYANVNLSWLNNISRLRIGGSGIGTQNGLQIQGVGNKTFFHVNDGYAQVFNPNNAGANVGLSWQNDIARIRVGGSGTGTTNGFEIQTVGDAKLFRISHNGDAEIYGFLKSKNFVPLNPNNSSASIGISWHNNTSRLRIGGSGDGTQNGLQIQGVGNKTFFHVNDGYAQVFNPNNAGANVGLSWQNDIARIRVGGSGTGTTNGFEIQTVGDAKLFRISHNGDAAIYGKLEVKEIKVTSAPTADFVFYDNYKLRAIEEVEAFIKKNKHLPDFPSASEIEKNGANLAEMDAKLLQKIEELTLYTIGQEKILVAQQEEIQAQQAQLAEKDRQLQELLRRMERLEKMMEQ